MAGSDNEAAALPKAEIKRITRGIQDAVKQQFQESSDAESLTVNIIRSRAELNLKLEKDSLKTDPFWRNESKRIIREEFERQNDAVEQALNPPSPSKKEAPKKRKAAAGKRKVEAPEEPQSSKKPSRERAEKPKTEAVESAVTLSVGLSVGRELSDDEDEMPTTKKRPRTKANAAVGKESQTKTPDPEAVHVGIAENVPEEGKSPAGEGDAEGTEEKVGVNSESEMSEVLDVTPKKKRQRTASSSKTKTTSKAATTTKAPGKGRAKKSKDAAPVDADTEKIKELQGWLVKCGIRKLWGKELAKFSSTKEKINHLKAMLADVGMTGRYSNERAKKINEERELAADLEAVQQGAKVWGAESGNTMKTRSSRTSEAPVKTRKLVRPPELAFLEDQSEESD